MESSASTVVDLTTEEELPFIFDVSTTPSDVQKRGVPLYQLTSSDFALGHDTVPPAIPEEDGDEKTVLSEMKEAARPDLVYTLQGATFIKKRHPPPWIPKDSGKLTLHEEILAFVAYMSPTPEEKRMREEVTDRVASVIYNLWPSARVSVFGSAASNLFLPLSDIDMGVAGATGHNPLGLLAAAFRRRGEHHNIETINKARVPIIKLVDADTRCPVDISFDSANGSINTAIIRRFCEAAPEVRPLVIVLKYYLSQMGLNEPFTGGLGSYTLLLMVISYLQLQRPAGSAGKDLGELLKGFFEFYGIRFNYHRTGISVRSGGQYYSKKALGRVYAAQPWLLSIEDPGDLENDVSKSSWGIIEVRECFRHAYRALTSTSAPHKSAPSFLARILVQDPKILKHRHRLSELYAEAEQGHKRRRDDDDDENDDRDPRDNGYADHDRYRPRQRYGDDHDSRRSGGRRRDRSRHH